MGGRAAEQLVFGHLTTGAANDLESATALARKMVCELGMSDALGPLTFGKKEEMVFLGREIASHKDYSETTAQLIDKEVRIIVEGAYNRALDLLRKDLDKLHLLAKTLLERRTSRHLERLFAAALQLWGGLRRLMFRGDATPEQRCYLQIGARSSTSPVRASTGLT